RASVVQSLRFGCGYDALCCRDGYPVSPVNVAVELPKAVAGIRAAGLALPMVTGPTDLVDPEDARVPSIFGAMQSAGIRFFKPGYFMINHRSQDY
ncbi:MAG: hypothetical protein HY360_02590, partial [Verrucomicrobia bacterium]|nr:hypothetical protein [Verrucomicrobiota bacterium]